MHYSGENMHKTMLFLHKSEKYAFISFKLPYCPYHGYHLLSDRFVE